MSDPFAWKTCPACQARLMFESDVKRHSCPPSWKLWQPENGEEGPSEGRTVFGATPFDAAEKWAKRDDAEDGDYLIVGGCDAEVCMMGIDGVVHRIIVSGETVAVYTARGA